MKPEHARSLEYCFSDTSLTKPAGILHFKRLEAMAVEEGLELSVSDKWFHLKMVVEDGPELRARAKWSNPTRAENVIGYFADIGELAAFMDGWSQRRKMKGLTP